MATRFDNPVIIVGGSAGVFSWRLCWGSYRPVLVRSGVDPSFLFHVYWVFTCFIALSSFVCFASHSMWHIYCFHVSCIWTAAVLVLSLDLGGCYLRQKANYPGQ